MSKFGLFLSHSWSDKEFVEAFKARVETYGVKCWIDTEQMAPGADLHEAMAAGIENSAVFAAFVSDAYINSANCGKEFSLAVAWEKPLLPVRLVDGRWPPRGKMAAALAPLLYLNSSEALDDAFLAKTLAGLGIEMGSGRQEEAAARK